jgi:hypothetical protein
MERRKRTKKTGAKERRRRKRRKRSGRGGDESKREEEGGREGIERENGTQRNQKIVDPLLKVSCGKETDCSKLYNCFTASKPNGKMV